MSDSKEPSKEPSAGVTAFLLMLLGSAAEKRERLSATMDRFSAPVVSVRLPILLVVRLVDGVTCPCDMCIGTLMWAKSIDKTQIDDDLRRVLDMSILNAEMRLLSDKQQEEYSQLYGHKSKKVQS